MNYQAQAQQGRTFDKAMREEPRLDTSVEAKLQALAKGIDALDQALGEHSQRLAPVVIGQPPTQIEKDPHPRPLMCTISERINAAVELVGDLEARVRTLTKAVDL